MPKITGSTVIKLLIACFLVGFGLAIFRIDPRDLFTHAAEMAQSIANWSVDMFGDAISYILLGAVVVIPIWLFFYLLRAVRGRR
ncbi:MAG: DUF6460 domain-containing protein [Pseudomonadota bacterium]